MKIGYFDYALDLSVKNYINKIVPALEQLGVEMIPFGFRDGLPQGAYIYWDLRPTGTTLPTEKFLSTSKPIVVTLHGSAPLGMIALYKLPKFKKTIQWYLNSQWQLMRWRRWSTRISAAITPSSSAKKISAKMFGLSTEKIFPIHHGVDHNLFKELSEKRSFFLHVSQYQPVKNFNRIIEAYQKIKTPGKPKLIGIVPNYPKRDVGDNIVIIRDKVPQAELISYYNRAIAFLFPSLYESFGMPIVEAMSCGAPVITSARYACAEVAGDAALLVNPYSVRELMDAMLEIMNDPVRQIELSHKSVEHSCQFSWEKSARLHLDVFERVLQ